MRLRVLMRSVWAAVLLSGGVEVSGNKPAGQDTDFDVWAAFVDVFRPAEGPIDLTTPCLEFQCFRLEDVGQVYQRLEDECEFG